MPRYIDADELKAKFCNHCDERDCKPDATDTVYGCVIADTIDNIPIIEAEPVKHGRWIKMGYEDYECSNCKAALWARKVNPVEKYKYCWSCGAKMDGDVNE